MINILYAAKQKKEKPSKKKKGQVVTHAKSYSSINSKNGSWITQEKQYKKELGFVTYFFFLFCFLFRDHWLQREKKNMSEVTPLLNRHISTKATAWHGIIAFSLLTFVTGYLTLLILIQLYCSLLTINHD